MFNKNKSFKIVISFVVILLMMSNIVVIQGAEPGAGTVGYKHIYDYGNGFSFTNTTMHNSLFGTEKSFVAETLPGALVKPFVVACDTIFGSMNINSVISYARGRGQNVMGGINSDFFAMATGIPLGIVVENGIYKSSPEGKSSICFDSQGGASINKSTSIQIKLTNQGGGILEDGSSNMGKSLTLTHFNKKRIDGAGLYLYSSDFSTISTRTTSPGWAVKFQILNGEMKTEGNMTLQVTELYEGSSPMGIGQGYMVLTADNTSGLDWQFKKFAVGDVVSLDTHCYNNDKLANCLYASGGGDVLLENGAITNPKMWDKALSGKNPRTAVGIKADGKVVYFTLDGRRTGHSNGITMYQLAEELKALGCISAINMDGGGSTSISMRLPGEAIPSVKNKPSDGAARKCSTFILFKSDGISDGIPTKLFLKEDGQVVYQGSDIKLSYFATDNAYTPVNAPQDVNATMESGSFGKVEDNTFLAPYKSGAMNILLSSPSTGITGRGMIYVVQKLDDIDVKVNGKDTSTLSLDGGETIEFTQSAKYQGENVIIHQNDFKYTVSDGFGTISDTGILEVPAEVKGTGIVTITAGGVTKKIKLVSKSAFQDTGGNWAENYIEQLADKGIVTGSNGYFYPQNKIKRGDFVLMLYRGAGSPAITSKVRFLDVSDSDYYSSAVNWARSSGIAKGDGISFNPQSNMTREDAFTFIYRYLVYRGIIKPGVEDTSLKIFTDVGEISDYAIISTAALVDKGIINGQGGKIIPKGMLSRAEMAKILYGTLN